MTIEDSIDDAISIVSDAVWTDDPGRHVKAAAIVNGFVIATGALSLGATLVVLVLTLPFLALAILRYIFDSL